MNNLEIVSKMLRERRITNSVTQEKLAELAGMNAKYLGRIERNENNPTLKKVIDICNALKMRLVLENIEITKFDE